MSVLPIEGAVCVKYRSRGLQRACLPRSFLPTAVAVVRRREKEEEEKQKEWDSLFFKSNNPTTRVGKNVNASIIILNCLHNLFPSNWFNHILTCV